MGATGMVPESKKRRNTMEHMNNFVALIDPLTETLPRITAGNDGRTIGDGSIAAIAGACATIPGVRGLIAAMDGTINFDTQNREIGKIGDCEFFLPTLARKLVKISEGASIRNALLSRKGKARTEIVFTLK